MRTDSGPTADESVYRSLVESLPQCIFRKDREGRFTFANSHFCASVNRSKSEVIGKTDADIFPPALAAKYRSDDIYVYRSRKTIDMIEELASSGGTIYVHVVKTPILNSSGEVVGVQGTFWDETERYKAQEALEQERDLMRAIMENVPDRIYFKDTQSRFICISNAFAERMGLSSPNEAIGKTDADFFTAEHAQAALADEKAILTSGQPIIGKVEKEIWTDGVESWCLTTKMPLRSRDGSARGTFGISRDITELKQTERKLSQARDEALESARLKSEFLANMSHEIRTPMNGIIGMTGLMLDTQLTGDQRDFTETIRNSAEALLTIINDILDFSKIEAGKLRVEEVEFDVLDVVEGAGDLLAKEAQKKGIELATCIHQETPRRVVGDPGRVRQILMNLLGNAVKFTERGEVVLEVTQIGTGPAPAKLHFSVRDTGIGIPLDAQSRIFGAFTQADGSMTRRYGGTGLGLAISRQLVELMGGAIGFTSEPGKGSTFWFDLPLGIGTKTPETQAALNRQLEGLRVLIVDDNATNRRILEHQTNSWRMRNVSVDSAEAALKALHDAVIARDPFKIVLLDMQMPVMDGLTLARKIKANPAYAGAKLVMLTSLGHPTSETHWRSAGISAYLVKPVKQDRLLDVLIEVVTRQDPAERDDSKTQPSAAAKTQANAIRILLAEDNVVNQKVALRQLKKLGYAVDAVNNGLEAVRAMEKQLYPVVLMDCQMPEMDGYEATGRIRQMEKSSLFRWPHRPYIIAITANALAGDREVCLARGMDDYVSKPVRVEDLQSALERALNSMHTDNQSNPPKPTASSEKVVDFDMLASLRELRMEGEPDPLAELIELFLSDTPKRLEQIQAALKASAAHDLEAAAHSLKGSSSNLGAAPLAAACAKVMQNARNNDLATATQNAPAIEAEFAKVKVILLEELKK